MSFLMFCNSGSGCSFFLVSFSVCLYSFWNAGWRVYLFCGPDFQKLWFLTLLLWLQGFSVTHFTSHCPPWFQGDSTFSDCMDQKYYCVLLGTSWSSLSFSLLSWFAQPFSNSSFFFPPNEGLVLKGIGLASSLDYMEHLVSPSLARWNLHLICHNPVSLTQENGSFGALLLCICQIPTNGNDPHRHRHHILPYLWDLA